MDPGWENGERWHQPRSRYAEAYRRHKLRVRWRRYPQLGAPPACLSGEGLPEVPDGKDIAAMCGFLWCATFTNAPDPFSSDFLFQKLKLR